MAESSFNMNTFLNEYKGYNTKKFTAEELAKQNMEAQDIARAAEAVAAQEENSLLSLTLKGKLKEAGIGEHVMKQIADTAENIITGWIDPIADYLEKYENIFDQRVYNQQLHEAAMTHFLNKQQLQKITAENTAGVNFNAMY